MARKRKRDEEGEDDPEDSEEPERKKKKKKKKKKRKRSESGSDSSASPSPKKKKKKKKSKKSKKKKKKKSKKKKKKKKKKKSNPMDDSSLDSSVDEADVMSDGNCGPIKIGSEVYQPISIKDYYRKNQEFRHWLLNTKSKRIENMTTKKAKKIFMSFVRLYNMGGVDKDYYKGISITSQDPADRTKHNWNLNLTEKEEEDLINTRDEVDTETYHPEPKEHKHEEKFTIQANVVGMVIGRGGSMIKEIKRKSGAEVDIDSKGDGNSDLRLITISGPKRSTEIAIRLIRNIVQQSRLSTRNRAKQRRMNDDNAYMN